MPEEILKQLQAALQAADYDAELAPIVEGLPAGQLLVYLGEDEQERDFYLQLLFLSDLQRAVPGAPRVIEGPEDVDYMQFYSALPFTPVETAFGDLARLMLALNWNIPVGGFGLNETQQAAFFRQVLLCPRGQVDPEVVVETVNSMTYWLGEYVDALEAVGTGAQTLAGVLAGVPGPTAQDSQ